MAFPAPKSYPFAFDSHFSMSNGLGKVPWRSAHGWKTREKSMLPLDKEKTSPDVRLLFLPLLVFVDFFASWLLFGLLSFRCFFGASGWHRLAKAFVGSLVFEVSRAVCLTCWSVVYGNVGVKCVPSCRSCLDHLLCHGPSRKPMSHSPIWKRLRLEIFSPTSNQRPQKRNLPRPLWGSLSVSLSKILTLKPLASGSAPSLASSGRRGFRAP